MFRISNIVKRGIFYAVVFVLHIISDTSGQTPVLTITSNTVKIGSNFTVTCNVITNSVIQFFLNDNEEGSCPPPFLGQPCNPTDIKQDTTAGETSWTLTAETGYEGSWKCSRSSVNSTSIAVNMYNCPNAIISESGITTNVTLNDTATVTIKVKIDCIYPAINPEISLQFMSSDSPSIPSTIMSCSQTTGTCSAGSAFECTQLISFDGTTLSSGSPPFEKEKSYSLNINVEPSTGTCNLLAIFESYRLMFETTGPETTTQDTSSTKEQSTIGSSFMFTTSSRFTTIGSGKTPTEILPITSTDNDFTPTNASVLSGNKSLLVPLVSTVSVVIFCLVICFIVVISIVYRKRNSKGQTMSEKNSDLTLTKSERHGYQTHGTSVPERKDDNDKKTNLQSRSKYMYNCEISSDKYSNSKRDVQQQRSRHINKNYRVYNGADERGQAFVYYRNNDFSRPRQKNIQDEYKVYNGHNRRGVMNSHDLYYSYPNYSFY